MAMITCQKCGQVQMNEIGKPCIKCRAILGAQAEDEAADIRRGGNREEFRNLETPQEDGPIMAVEAKTIDGKEYLWLRIIAAISFLASLFFVYQGYDKITNYYNSDTLTSLNKNAYVGGDAYNYIINGNYATGFFVLAMLCVVVGFGCLILRQLKINGDRLGG